MTEEPPGARREKPFVFACEAGVKYAYCLCQQSAIYPRCDGSHRQIGDGMQIRCIKVIPEAGGELRWCACGRSKTKPDCDGSHTGS